MHLKRRRPQQPTPVLLPGKSHGRRSLVGCSPWGPEESDMTERLHFHFHLHALEKAMATHSSVLAWRIPGTAELGGLPAMGSQRVRHDWSDLAAAAVVKNPPATAGDVRDAGSIPGLKHSWTQLKQLSTAHKIRYHTYSFLCLNSGRELSHLSNFVSIL